LPNARNSPLINSESIQKRSDSVFKEFREFIMRGNVLDLAVAVVLGTAFNAIVTSLVNDLIMPLIAMVFGAPDFSGWTLGQITYGNFLNAVINFLIVGIAMFAVVKVANTLMRKKAEAPVPPAPTAEENLLVEIRDLIAAQNAQR
jgi:large conductance mechanosensitive channel